MALAIRQIPELRGEFLGDGPERAALDAAIVEHGLQGVVSARGFTEASTLDQEMRRAMCTLLPSRREGYGLVVVESSARATPSIVVAGEDNAASELIEEGVNGTIAAESTPQAVADAIVRVYRAGFALRQSTASWYAENAQRLSLEASLGTVLSSYEADRAGDAPVEPSARA
jgi:glycosyltransferase involved in cell wall biosynthesis